MFFLENIEWIFVGTVGLVVNLVLAAIVIFMLVKFGLKVRNAAKNDWENVPSAIWSMRWRGLMTIILTVLALSFINASYLYRPKNVLDGGHIEDRIKVERERRANQPAPDLYVPPPETPTWEEKREQNRQEQDEAKDAFEQLPDDDNE